MNPWPRTLPDWGYALVGIIPLSEGVTLQKEVRKFFMCMSNM
jgi:hypothetical protein